jgi:S-adenosylmethionine hydrolase
MPAALSLITLLTDFGDRDYFVASMKGVILSINPQAQIVDVSHQIRAHDIAEGAYLLKSCFRYFPEGTVHVAVIDPGVGTARRPILVSTSRFHFVGPDNGIFTHVLAEEQQPEVRQIQNRQYRLDAAGATFDGRDLFAPAAAWLTKGQPPSSFGPLLSDYERFSIREPRWERQVLVGEIVYIDRFGNLISNFTRAHVDEVRAVTKRGQPVIRLADITIEGLVHGYGEGRSDVPAALVNSNGQLEVFCKEGRAADQLGLCRGARIDLS